MASAADIRQLAQVAAKMCSPVSLFACRLVIGSLASNHGSVASYDYTATIE